MNGQQARMYRLYFFDEFHRVESWQALYCVSDSKAFAEAAALMGDSIAVEIVEGIRIVGTFTVRIPTMPSGHTELKASSYSDLMPSTFLR